MLDNIGELSKPATVLVERISDAFEGAFKPFQIKRIAEAETEAAIIKARGEIEISELHRRALTRFVGEETKKQINIESITNLALPELKEDARPEDMEEDWIFNFLDKCRLTSDEDMQMLWAKILSGEANNPGSFSKRTIHFMQTLDKSDAILFKNLCRHNWNGENLEPTPFINSYTLVTRQDIQPSLIFKKPTLDHLKEIGLLNLIDNHLSLKEASGNYKLFYFGLPVRIRINSNFPALYGLSLIKFTQIGRELALICGADPDIDVMDLKIKEWIENNSYWIVYNELTDKKYYKENR